MLGPTNTEQHVISTQMETSLACDVLIVPTGAPTTGSGDSLERQVPFPDGTPSTDVCLLAGVTLDLLFTIIRCLILRYAFVSIGSW